MTEFERLMLEAQAAQIDLLRAVAKAVSAYHDARAKDMQEGIERALKADVVQALK